MKLSEYSQNSIKAERRAQCNHEDYNPWKHKISTSKGVELVVPEDPREWLDLIERGELQDSVISSYGDAPEGYVWIITK